MAAPPERRTAAGLTCVEICSGAGGQALGLELAGFAHAAAVDIDADACETLRRNRGSQWKIIEADLTSLEGTEFRGVDLLAGGVPCPPDASFPVGAAPRLTTRTVARLQGFPGCWEFAGRKTAAYRQVGNAFPPAVARAVAGAIAAALSHAI